MKRHFWTEKEKQKLRKLYVKMDRTQLMKEFPFATKSSIENAIQRYTHIRKEHNWTEKEINKLLKLYPKKTAIELLEYFPFATEISIRRIAKYYGAQSKVHKWTDGEIKKLLELYPTTNLKKLLKIFPFASDRSIWTIASEYGIKKANLTPPGKGLIRLLELDYEAAYWLGFILADGSTNRKQLQICVHKRDKKHLEKFVKFIGVGKVRGPYKRDNCVYFGRKEYKIVPLIRKQFDLKNSKTYNPPEKLPYNETDLLLACLAGLIDGDGCISYNGNSKRHCKIDVEMHRSWKGWLSRLNNALSNGTFYSPFGSIREFEYDGKEGASLNIRDNMIIAYLARKFDDMKLPLMKRKWNKINRNYKHVGKGWRNGKRLTYRKIRRSQ